MTVKDRTEKEWVQRATMSQRFVIVKVFKRRSLDFVAASTTVVSPNVANIRNKHTFRRCFTKSGVCFKVIFMYFTEYWCRTDPQSLQNVFFCAHKHNTVTCVNKSKKYILYLWGLRRTDRV